MSGVPLKLNGGVVAPPPIAVLVVDDHDPFRQFLTSTLQCAAGDFACWEASDGLEAVDKAEELQPELILLDIGLPKLNGIEAARRISKVSPGSKILFVSQESSVDLVQEAFRAGGTGYVVKADAGRELLTAIRVVLGGARFVGSRFDGHKFPGAFDVRASNSAPQTKEKTGRHEAQFYSEGEHFSKA
jgi:DNA-binding NarL/FixJ family response regulator